MNSVIEDDDIEEDLGENYPLHELQGEKTPATRPSTLSPHMGNDKDQDTLSVHLEVSHKFSDASTITDVFSEIDETESEQGVDWKVIVVYRD